MFENIIFIKGITILIVTITFGGYFSYTDISRRRIPNYPLIVFLILGFAVNFLFPPGLPFSSSEIMISFVLALVFGLIFYYLNFWHAGDSKLFIVTTFNIVPCANNPVLLTLFNLCLPIALCYVIMFPYLLIDIITRKGRGGKKQLMFILLRTIRSAISLEQIIQLIMVYAISLILPAGINIILKSIALYIMFYLVRNYISGHLKRGIKAWHLYGISAVILLAYIKIDGGFFPLVNLAYLFGFVCFFNFYLSLEFAAGLTRRGADDLEPGMKLGFPVYRTAGKIFSASHSPGSAEVIFQGDTLLTEAAINSLKEESKDMADFYAVIYSPGRSLPFAPFIIASSLFILAELLWRHLK